MFEIDTLLFLAFIGFGALIQTITGFAMNLIIVGGVALFGIADIAFTAAVTSLVSMVNTLLALRTSHRSVHWRYVKSVCLTMLPAILLGVWLLNYLSAESYAFLEKLLGVVIVAGGVLLMLKPAPFREIPPIIWLRLVGGLGGVIGGLFGAGGPPLAYYMYRQPIEINIIRSTLLTVFTISTLMRTIIVGIDGQLTEEVWTMVALAIPIVLLVTIGTARMLRFIPDAIIRKFVFALLVLMGLFLVIK